MIPTKILVDVSQPLKANEGVQLALSPGKVGTFLRHIVFPFLQRRLDRRFSNEGDEVVGDWAPLAFNTGRIRAALGFPAWHPINRRTGELRRALRTFRITPGYGGILTIPDRVTARQASKIRVAQFGGWPTSGGRRFGPSRGAPARPVLGLGAEDDRYVSHALLEWIRNAA